MQLEYIWIEDYGVLKNKGFNFNPNACYSFDEKTGVITKEIKNEIPVDFFHIENDTISGITALVGSNGAGKSTALHFIASFLSHSTSLAGFIIINDCIINKSDVKIKLNPKWIGKKLPIVGRADLINKYKNNQGNFNTENDSDDKHHALGLQILGNYINDTIIINFAGEINLENTTRVYQSLFSLSEEYENGYYVDISDISLMTDDQNKYKSDKAVYSGENPILTYRSGESQRNLDLLHSKFKQFIPFSIDNLAINMLFNDIDTTFFTTYDEMAFSPLIDLFVLLIEKEHTISEQDQLFFKEIKLNGLGGYFRKKFYDYNPSSVNGKLRKHLYYYLLLRHIREQIMQTMGELSENNKLTPFMELIQDVMKNFNNKNSYTHQIRSYFKRSSFAENFTGKLDLEALDSFENKIRKLKIWDYKRERFDLSKLPDLDALNSTIKNFDKESKVKYTPTTIFDLDIRGLSTGEKQFLKIFSRFISYELNNLIYKKVKQFIILIDEFEIGFHPLWQRKFLKIWIDFLEKYVNQTPENKIKVQLILTSHSPFVVSDLPKQCINFLTKSESKKNNQIETLNKHNATFGANIHSLFTDAFFISDGLMGDFAQYKIDLLIKEIFKQEKYTHAEYEGFKPLINIIGEPFIRAKLFEKIAKGMETSDIDLLISERERETNYLRSIRNDKDPA